MLKYTVLPVLIAFILDFIFQDRALFMHPIVLIGKMISKLTEFLLDKKDKNITKFFMGLFMIVILMIFILIPVYVIDYYTTGWVNVVYRSLALYYAIALNTLGKEANMVGSALKVSLNKGQKQVARIVGRDTSVLDSLGVIKATVETVAENTSDGVIAPYFYFLLLGPVGAYLYKIGNTLDSMVAYRNEKYEYFGKASARLDDLLNIIPSRLTGIFACLCAPAVSGSILESFKVFIRDRYKHKSPNSAQCESAFAGALGIELMGDAVYEGKIEKKDYINKGKREAKLIDIKRSVFLMNVLTIVLVLVTLLIKYLIVKK